MGDWADMYDHYLYDDPIDDFEQYVTYDNPKIIHQTDKAVLYQVGTRQAWIPKSVHHLEDDGKVLVVKEWFEITWTNKNDK